MLHCTGQGVRSQRSKIGQRSVRSVSVSDRSVGDLRSTGRKVWKKQDAAGRFESFLSLSLERERSAGETAHRWTHTGASVFDRRQKFCDSAARLDGLAKLSSRSNGLEGQTEPEMKTATHGLTRVEYIYGKALQFPLPLSLRPPNLIFPPGDLFERTGTFCAFWSSFCQFECMGLICETRDDMLGEV